MRRLELSKGAPEISFGSSQKKRRNITIQYQLLERNTVMQMGKPIYKKRKTDFFVYFYPKLCNRSDWKERTCCITWGYPDLENHLEGVLKGLIFLIVYSICWKQMHNLGLWTERKRDENKLQFIEPFYERKRVATKIKCCANTKPNNKWQ